jgi:hypothetical protein
MSKNMKKMLIISLALIIGFSILAVGSWYINYYVYSWTYYILPCDEKKPMLLNFNRPYGEDLGEQLDLEKLKTEISKKSNFEPPRYSPYTHVIEVEKRYDGKPYIIRLSNEKNTTKYEIMGGMRPNTIPCSTPDYKILMNTYQMIDELPLTDAQKQKLKDLTTVRGGYTPHWG